MTFIAVGVDPPANTPRVLLEQPEGATTELSKSPKSTRSWRRGEFHNLTFCTWEGYVERRPNGQVEIYYYP